MTWTVPRAETLPEQVPVSTHCLCRFCPIWVCLGTRTRKVSLLSPSGSWLNKSKKSWMDMRWITGLQYHRWRHMKAMLHEVPDASCVRINLAFLLTWRNSGRQLPAVVSADPLLPETSSSLGWCTPRRALPRAQYPPTVRHRQIAWHVHQGSTSGDPKFRSGYQILPW